MGEKTTFWNYTSFQTIDISDYASCIDGTYHIVFSNISNNKLRIRGDGDIMVHVDAARKGVLNNISKTSFVFENNGNVSFVGCGVIKLSSLMFENHGNVSFSYSSMPVPSVGELFRKSKKNTHTLAPKVKYMCCDNTGDVIVEDTSVQLDDISRIRLNNEGSVKILSSAVLHDMVVCSRGNCVLRADSGLRKSSFTNTGYVVVAAHSVDDCVFENDKRVLFPPAYPDGYLRFTGHKTVFNNGSGVDIMPLDTGFSVKRIEFRNCGHVRFGKILNNGKRGTRYLYGGKHTHITFRNRGDVRLDNIYKIRSEKIVFDNIGSVYADSLSRIEGELRFLNVNDVYMRGIDNLYSPGYIYVGNYGKFVADSFTMTELSTLTIASKGMVFLNKYINLKKSCIKHCLLCTNEKGRSVYRTLFLRRFNVPVEEGFVTLYKVVSKGTKMALYDGIETKWDVGEIIEHPNWEPSIKEMGVGKYVATAVPETMFSMLSRRVVTVLTLRISIDDLYEWPSETPDYPQYIGFRRAEVVDSKDVKITNSKKK